MVRLSTPRAASADNRGGRGWVRRATIALGAGGGVGIVVAAVVMVMVAAISISSTLRSALISRSGATTARELLGAIALAPIALARAYTDTLQPDQLSIDIKFKNLHLLHERRSLALRTRQLVVADDELVPATITTESGVVKVRLHLAGQRVDLLEGSQWPLRVRLVGEGHVFGMRSFVLRPPAQRGYQIETLFLDHLQAEDVITPRFRFAKVSINGKNIGLMAVEEFFSREMLEAYERRDAPILRLVPATATRRRTSGKEPSNALRFDPMIEASRPNSVERPAAFSRNFQLASNLLRAHLMGNVAAGDVFDVELMGRYLALSEIWGARSGRDWRDFRFYFNPMTARLEPVAYAAELQQPIVGEGVALSSFPFVAGLLADPQISAATSEALRRIAEEVLTPQFTSNLRQRELPLLRLLHREFPLRLAFDLEPMQRRATAAPDLIALLAASEPPSSFRNRTNLLPLPSPSVPEVLAQHSGLTWNPRTRFFSLPPGSWMIEGSLILPPAAGLMLEPGTVLHFDKGEGIIARGPLVFRGTEDSPVVLQGPVGVRSRDLWAGIYVVESTASSRWTHVVVRDTGGFRRKNWHLAAGVVFRKSRIEMADCQFRGNRSDDALNVVRGQFALHNVSIVESLLDAFDADYSEGVMEGVVIRSSGGDGIDLGGSRVDMRNISISDIDDKAISVGEASRVRASEIDIEKVAIGVASKNGAETLLESSSVRNVSGVALTAYVNRAQFGPGRLIAKDLLIENVALDVLAQSGSSISLDGHEIAQVDAAIEALHKDVKHRKQAELQ